MLDTLEKNNKSALIVGGGNGLGAEIAKFISKRYNKHIIIADLSISTEIKNSTFIKLDLSYEDLSVVHNLDIDMLIITAGIGRLSKFETFSIKEIEKNFYVNTFPSLNLISAYYNKIKSSENFYTCVISSIAGVVASPLYSVYSASKAALVKFTEGINAELAYSNFDNRILNVAPGNFSGTSFHGNKSLEGKDKLVLLASNIIEKTLNKETIYIPDYDEIYKGVLQRYRNDCSEFAKSSIEYKLKHSKTNDFSQIKVGYLTGTFDLFHIGHLNLLKNAKKYCDKLIVGVHPDAKHKNKEVFIPLDERMEILRNIKFVDEVIVCADEDIDDYPKIKYDYLFVGSDYLGTERFNRYEQYFSDKNVRIIYLPYTTKTSSTQLRNLISAKSPSRN